MSMKNLSRKSIIIIISALIIIIAATIVTIVIIKSKSQNEHRIIKVYKVEGETIVNRSSVGEISAYDNMVLESGDSIKVLNGKLTLKLDDDKYVYAFADTEFKLTATGTPRDSKTRIDLVEGNLANDIQKKLSDNSYYEINTPNSTMSVKGTVYWVSTYIDADGNRVTRVSVFDGAVATNLLRDGDTIAGYDNMIQKGKEIYIIDDENGTITDVNKNVVLDIDSDTIPSYLLDVLETISETRDIAFGTNDDILQDKEAGINNGPCKVTFNYNGKEFCYTEVEWGNTVDIPKLSPGDSGGWDFDFNTLIKEDTIITWK